MYKESGKYETPSPHVSASTAVLPSSSNVSGKEPEELQKMMGHFGNISFLVHMAQEYEQYSLLNSYRFEEEAFVKTVKLVLREEFQYGSNGVTVIFCIRGSKMMMDHLQIKPE